MSMFWDAMLIPQLGEEKAINDLNLMLMAADTHRSQKFNKIDMGGAGGSKSFTTDIYAACFNFFGPHEVEPCICRAAWHYPHRVLYFKDPGDYSHETEDDYTYWNSFQTVTELRERLEIEPLVVPRDLT